MKNIKTYCLSLVLLTLAVPALAQEQDKAKAQQPVAQTTDKATDKATGEAGRVAAGQKQKLSGVVIRRDGDTLVVRDLGGADYNVLVSGTTKIQERKGNPFRRAKEYGATNLLRGLSVEVEGRGNDAGALVADRIKFSDDEFRVARSIETRVTPVEGDVKDNAGRISQAEQNAQRLSGQIEELAAVSNAAKGGAKAAQESADAAMAEAKNANEGVRVTNERVVATNERISSLDDYEERKVIAITFKVGSAVLSPEAKTALDELATQAKTEKGHVIQVAGFASADGNETLNRRLSQRRADAVISYLVENHDISQRRIITPVGFGEARPTADNNTREGRQQNRRVEVAILVSKGLTTAPAGNSAQRTSSVPPQQ